MSKKDNCSYTTMLNSIKMLDEQICEMQNTLKNVKDMMRRNFEERMIDKEKEVSDADQIRAASMEAMLDEKTGDEK